MRRALVVNAADHRLFGTMHEPEGASSGDCLLMLNAGPLPRSWNSDLPCEIGDVLAGRGITTFRFDLPGLGDTDGETPEFVELFRQGISNGRYDRTVRELSRELRSAFGLKRIIVSGLCAGAVASVRAVTASPDDFAGMIMFEPDFRGAIDTSAMTPAGKALPPPAPERTRSEKARLWVKSRFGRTAIEDATWLGPMKAPLVRAMSLMFGHKLPPGSNAELVDDWRKIIHRRLPTLVLRAERGVDWRTRRILQSLPARALSRSVSIVLIPKTNHMFNSGVGQSAALKAVVDWVLGKFPHDSGNAVAMDGSSALNGRPAGSIRDERSRI